MKALRLLLLVVLSTATAWLAFPPFEAAAQSPRSIAAGQSFTPYVANGDSTYGLSQREGQRLLAGRGMGLARPAEMNGYPGPMHVLDLADELSLTPEQKQQARAARERVMTEAPALGRQIVDKELALDRLFRDGSADEAQIRALTQKIAQLRAELRAIHLQAHLVMQRALAVEQLRTYIEARGHPMPARLRPDTP
jgi:Spy/CpxP family protein refolding chaperone